MRRFRIPLAVLLLSIWALLIGLDDYGQDDIVDILLLVPALALALWAMADNVDRR